MEGNSAGEFHLGSVLPITQYGMSQLGQLQPDLMFAAGFELDFQEREAVEVCQAPVLQSGLLGPCHALGDYVHPPMAFILDQPVDALTRGISDEPFNNRPVRLGDRSGPELLGESSGGLRGSSQQDEAGHGCIEAANYTDVYVTRFVVAMLHVELGQGEQRGLAWGGPHCRQASRFGHGQEVIVFVDDVQ